MSLPDGALAEIGSGYHRSVYVEYLAYNHPDGIIKPIAKSNAGVGAAQ